MKENEKVYTTKEAKKDICLDLAPYVIILVFVFLTRAFIASPIRVNGSSMFPTLENGNVMILYKLSKPDSLSQTTSLGITVLRY